MMRSGFLGAYALVLVAFAAWFTYAELRPFLSGGGDREARYQAMVEHNIKSGLSAYSQDIVLRGCLEAITSVYGRLQPAAQRAAVRAHCETETAVITQLTPTNAFGWFTRALVAAWDNNVEEMNNSLNMSRMTGLNEQWIAELRVDLAEDNHQKLDALNLAGNDTDIVMLINSQRGIRAIAQRYLAQPAFRQRVTAFVETLPEERQRAFVSTVRQTAEERGLL